MEKDNVLRLNPKEVAGWVSKHVESVADYNFEAAFTGKPNKNNSDNENNILYYCPIHLPYLPNLVFLFQWKMWMEKPSPA